jgi:tetratricopeptide (TPR) repeat protein
VAQVDALMAAAFFVPDRAARFKAAEETLIKLLRKEPDNAKLHFTLGYVQVFTDRALQGIAEYERALALDPNLAGAHAQIGNAKLVLGYPEETEKHVLEALRLSPRDTAAFGWAQFIGNAKLALGKTEEAVTWLRRSIEITAPLQLVIVGSPSHWRTSVGLRRLATRFTSALTSVCVSLFANFGRPNRAISIRHI